MKWHTIKKYKPPTGVELLLRIETIPSVDSNFGATYERYVVAELECEYQACEVENLDGWYLSNGCVPTIDLSKYRITHFAIPDAVEIEHE